VGHSTGGGEVIRYLARHGVDRAATAVLISAVPPIMVQTETNPGGLPKPFFDGLQAQVATNRASLFWSFPSGPFYGYNRDGVEPDPGIIANWWRQGMTGGAKAHYDGVVAFSQTDFTDDLRAVQIPVLVMHGDDDQVVPYADCGPLSAQLLPKGILKTYPGYPHGMPTTHADVINADLLELSGPDLRPRSSGRIDLPPSAPLSRSMGVEGGNSVPTRGCPVRHREPVVAAGEQAVSNGFAPRRIDGAGHGLVQGVDLHAHLRRASTPVDIC